MSRATVTSRRDFLRAGVTAAGGLAVGFPAAGDSPDDAVTPPRSLHPLLRIEPDGRVVFRAPGPEIGQQLTTAQAMLIAETLAIDVNSLTIERAPLLLERGSDGAARWSTVPQFAGGSQALRRTWQGLLGAGLLARDRLVRAAAARWGVPAEECRVVAGGVQHEATARRLGYGALAADAAALADSPIDPPAVVPDFFQRQGLPQRSLDHSKVVTGQAEFGIDVVLPDLVYAAVERAPNFGARVRDYDDAAAKEVEGVITTVLLEGAQPPHCAGTIIADGVAVVAKDIWTAFTARRRLRIEWDDGPFVDEDNATFDRQAIDKMAAARPVELRGADDYRRAIESGVVVRRFGDVGHAFRQADRRFTRTYEIPFGAHATMEPQNCTAHVHAHGCDLHVPTQVPRNVAAAIADLLEIDVLDVNVYPRRAGGGFGRRLQVDFVLEAVMISKAVGRPVQVVWTREDDLRYDYFRPRALLEMNAAFAGGRLTAWHVREASTPLEKHPQELAMGKSWPEIEVAPFYAKHRVFAAEELYFDNFPAHPSFVANLRMDYFYVHSGAPRHAWRAPGLLALEFANQSFLDEIAHELDEDPLEFRLRLIGEPNRYAFAFDWVPDHESERLAQVLQRAAAAAHWGRYRGLRGVGQGIAATYNWGTYVAHVVDVAVDAGGALTVAKVTSAVDCGPVIHPDGVRKQVEGGVNDALSMALHQQIDIAGGRVVQSNFHDYRMMRIDESPREIEVIILEAGRRDDLRGMGEPPVPPLAPALCNAIFAATGRRIRRLPIADQLRS